MRNFFKSHVLLTCILGLGLFAGKINAQTCHAGYTLTTDSINPKKRYFTNTSTNDSACFYEWRFGDDGGYSTSKNPIHSYAYYGTYTVCLKISRKDCVDSLCTSITINPPPGVCVANFTVTRDSLNDKKVHFSNTSMNDSGASYFWHFNGNSMSDTSTQKNPVKVYGNYGTPQICLLITKPGCSDSICKLVTLDTYQCIADFNYFTDLKKVTFKNTSSWINSSTAFLWDFGDSLTGTSTGDVVHTYAAFGTYTVCMRMNKPTCTDSICRLVKLGPCMQSWTYEIDVFAGVGYFHGTKDSTTYKWELGDGTSSTQQHPIHSYAAPGNYNVCLKTTKAGCSDSSCKLVRIEFWCKADVKWTIDSLNTRHILFMSNSAHDSGVAYSWHFYDDNTTSTLKNPQHTYAAKGQYMLSLVITRASTFCYDSVIKYIQVADNTPPQCHANFNVTTDASNSFKRNFVNTSTNDSGCTYLWRLGDSNATSTSRNADHIYSHSGSFSVCLIINKAGCHDSICKSFTIYPTANCHAGFEYGLDTIHGILNLFNTSYNDSGCTYHWNFGDGETSSLKSPSHTYGAPGIYQICLKISRSGCADSICKMFKYTIDTAGCFADFSYSLMYDSLSHDSLVAFFNHSTGNALNFYWSFGDSITSTDMSPSHAYAVGGSYLVCLVAFSYVDTCADSICVLINAPAKTGLKEISELSQLHVYPVPFTNTLNLSFNMMHEKMMEIKLYDMLGVLHHTENYKALGGTNQLSMDLGNLAKGFYFLKIELGEGSKIVRVVK